MEIPKPIQEQLEDYGFNHASSETIDGKTYWFLSLVDEEGHPLPTGRPVIFQQLTDGHFYELEDDQVHKLLSKLD